MAKYCDWLPFVLKYVHLTVSFSGDKTELVSAEMLADVIVLVTVLTGLPGIQANPLHFAND